MTTYIIIARNQTERETHAIQITQEQNIHPLDISFLETQGSIGIEDIRNFQKQAMLKPLKGDRKAAIIKNAHTLTTEAQNALLKILEEPPHNTSIFLTAETSNNLLPTILSRTTIITLSNTPHFDEKESEEIKKQVERLASASTGEKLKLAEILATDKEKALQWIENAQYMLRKKLLETRDATQYIFLLESLQTTYIFIKTTNINSRFALECLFLNF